MQNVVLDTNILVRAFIRPESRDGKMLRLVFGKKLRLWYSQRLLVEIFSVLGYPRLKKYGVTAKKAESFVKKIHRSGTVIIPHNTNICRDQDDNEILGIALAISERELVSIITADKDLLVLKGTIEGVTIVTPQEFLKLQA